VTMFEARLRNKLSDHSLEQMVGKVLPEDSYDLLVTGHIRLLKPNGMPLLTFLPGAIPKDVRESTYPGLHRIRGKTDNRGPASGTARIKKAGTRTRSVPVMSSIVGNMEAVKPFGYCRLTAFTAKETESWHDIQPMFRTMADLFAEHVPDRYRQQMSVVADTQPEWVIPGTPYTTITVNNTYPTGVHTDKGDLDKGFSCLATLRHGNYYGGKLVFPQFRVAVDMHDGDMILMDAHEWHGNTAMYCSTCNERLFNYGHKCAESHILDTVPERISIVAYYRSNMVNCGTYEEELAKGQRKAERRSGAASV